LQRGSDKHEGSELTIAKLAAVHEFGIGVKERSFIRAWFDQDKPEIKKFCVSQFRRILQGADLDTVAEQVALKLGFMCKAFITDGRVEPANSDEWKAKKKSSKPLIWKGVLKSAIAGEVVK
jgi:hypothetical protein